MELLSALNYTRRVLIYLTDNSGLIIRILVCASKHALVRCTVGDFIWICIQEFNGFRNGFRNRKLFQNCLRNLILILMEPQERIWCVDIYFPLYDLSMM